MRPIAFLAAACMSYAAFAAELPMPNWPATTAGGLQFWSDHRVREGYRVQHNAVTRQWRLIDPNNVRLASGDESTCLDALQQHRSWNESDDDGRCVTLLLHGLMRSRRCMSEMAGEIHRRGGYPVCFGYASTRQTIAEHAASLDDVIRDWPPSWKIQVVAHSMGNIVFRHWIGDRQNAALRHIDDQRQLDRCRGMVMLGPPNQGSSIAKKLQPTGLFGLVTGDGGVQLGRDFDAIQPDLAVPPFPFLVIAGDFSRPFVKNPLLRGPNDLLVTVEETRLDQMSEHRCVDVLHAKLMSDPMVIRQTLDWLDRHE